MKKIIVPVDFSNHSEYALETASFLAKQANAEIIVVHMLELSNAIVSKSESYAQNETFFYLKLAEKKFHNFLQKDYLKGIKVTPIIKHFKIFSELDQLAREEDVDLIVMGSRGASGLKEIFIGSNTEKVIRYAHVPVLVIKEKPIVENIKKVVFACDFSDDDITPLLRAKLFFEDLDTKIDLVYVQTPSTKFKSTSELKEKIQRFLDKLGEVSFSKEQIHIVSDYTVEDGLRYYVNANDVEMLVIATKGRKGMARFFEGSITEDVANHSSFPLLTFKI
ncbi:MULTISPECIES: universal stress protein [unclassified Tenacibaculum]|uniref:universal stress protein n=1 Tax=unclassified Tenacibaculum TaxID=2635139 RepID=UPI001F449EBA|nr:MULTISPECIES: universal stress protein [unclassified Tenacibaculum]MCF2876295.1 universal stress protein [Tenacibaculum sp. Cn5-1]MCF2936370.1 universal stress protein [Tenacibaculum sp. Cn5-34]MCG7511713.1 universal stress protein [Tenacibaculum sp. Cn5-46]